MTSDANQCLSLTMATADPPQVTGEIPTIPPPKLTVFVTDTTPHIVWTDRYHFVILELMTDGNLLLFTSNNDVIKVPPRLYENVDFDFREFLVDDSTFFLDDDPVLLTIHHNLHGLPSLKGKRTPLDIINEFEKAQHRLLNPQRPLPIIKRTRPCNLPSEHAHDFIFWNFDIPHVDYYNAWYHSSNIWSLNKPTTYFSVDTHATIESHITDPTFPETPIAVAPPIPHYCGLNTHLYYGRSDFSDVIFSCPHKTPSKGLPADTTIYNLGQELPTCKIYFSYQPDDINPDIPSHFLDTQLLEVISFRNAIWNLPQYRVRLDHENKLSRFWTETSLESRLLNVRSNPEHYNNTYQDKQVQESLRFSKINNRGPRKWAYDLGLHLLNDLMTTKPGDHSHLDLNKLPTLPYLPIEDMDARGRGFQFHCKFYNNEIFRNVITPNLYALGNSYTNVYLDLIHDGSTVVQAWKRYRPPIRVNLWDAIADRRPYLKDIDKFRHPIEFVPFTNEEVARVTKRPPKAKLGDPRDWTPVLMPCHPTKCIPPPTLTRIGSGVSQTIVTRHIGVKRAYTATNHHLNSLIKHKVQRQCTYTHSTFWKNFRDGPIPFLVCGHLLDERNNLNLTLFQTDVLKVEPSDTQEFITFSPESGLCSFGPAQIRLDREPDPIPLPFSEHEPEVLGVPTWTCSPGCVVPATFEGLTVKNSPEYQQWLIFLAINSHRIKYLPNSQTREKCSINPNAYWYMYQANGYCTYYCTNFSMMGLSYHLPLYHPFRWTLAYQFTHSELNDLKWFQIDDFETAHVPNAVITRTAFYSPFYRITRSITREFCDFSTTKFGIGVPILGPIPDEYVIYEPFEADMTAVSKLLKHLRYSSHNTPDLAKASMKSLSLTHLQTELYNQMFIRQTTGLNPIPGTEEYKQVENALVDAIATCALTDSDIASVTEYLPEKPDPQKHDITSTSTESKILSKIFKRKK